MIPYIQGELENLCGLYSIVNSIKFVSLKNDAECHKIYQKLLRYTTENVPTAYKDGLYFKHLWEIMNSSPLPVEFSRPYARKKFDNAEQYIQTLETQLDGNTCAMVGIGLPWNHWTIIHKISPKTIHLFDSSGAPSIKRRLATLDQKPVDGHISLWPRMTIIVKNNK
jgi:hypothetical protein